MNSSGRGVGDVILAHDSFEPRREGPLGKFEGIKEMVVGNLFVRLLNIVSFWEPHPEDIAFRLNV
jgi:hypothetical protein